MYMIISVSFLPLMGYDVMLTNTHSKKQRNDMFHVVSRVEYIQMNDDLHDTHDQLATGYSDKQEARSARWLYRRLDNMLRDG